MIFRKYHVIDENFKNSRLIVKGWPYLVIAFFFFGFILMNAVPDTFFILVILYVFQSALLGVFSLLLNNNHNGKKWLVYGVGLNCLADAGASYYGVKEKDIALSVALKVGEIFRNHPDVEVVFTRKTDVFVELHERARIANKSKANLFLSIHCNGAESKAAHGTETWVLGLSKSASNLEVVKKENAVITYESDYKIKYQGYDPRSLESSIGIPLLQEEFIDQSISLASKIQKKYTNDLKLFNRGVKQGPFLVLNQTAMPSVLTELGFMSNREDNDYMNSEKGQRELAEAIAEAVLYYKKEYYGVGNLPIVKEEIKEKPVGIVQEIPEKKVEEKLKPETNTVVFKVQIKASDKKINTSSSEFNGLNPIDFYQEGGWYKYTFGEASNLNEAKDLQNKAKKAGFTNCFIVAFYQGKKITLTEAQKLL
jgi:N-acetylmuramoyl-L-alanine amidase